MLHGIDVSSYQGRIDWAAVRQTAEVAFAYVKATEGETLVDPMFLRNWQVLAERTPIRRGAYHFLRMNRDPALQAESFLAVSTPQAGDLLPAVDVETTDGTVDMQQRIDVLAAFTGAIQDALGGRRMLIYTTYGFWNDAMGGTDAFSGHPLWIAEYNADSAPALPAGWSDWTLWQHANDGRVNGIAGDVDLDRLNGDDDAMLALVL